MISEIFQYFIYRKLNDPYKSETITRKLKNISKVANRAELTLCDRLVLRRWVLKNEIFVTAKEWIVQFSRYDSML